MRSHRIGYICIYSAVKTACGHTIYIYIYIYILCGQNRMRSTPHRHIYIYVHIYIYIYILAVETACGQNRIDTNIVNLRSTPHAVDTAEASLIFLLCGQHRMRSTPQKQACILYFAVSIACGQNRRQ